MTAETTILIGDSLEEMRAMKTDSVDLVFGSPPYEAARTYGVDFKLEGSEWVEWAFVRFRECLRVCKGLVAWVVEGRTKNYSYSATPLHLAVKLQKCGMFLRKPSAFHRVGIPGSGGPDWLRNDYEFIVCATRKRGKLPWSDNTAAGHPPRWAPGGAMSHRLTDGTRRNQWGGCEGAVGHRKVDGTRDTHKRPSHVVTEAGRVRNKSRRPDGCHATGYDPPSKANPGNVIPFEAMDFIPCTVGKGHMGSDLAHENEAPFPESLADFWIRSFCPPDGVVLDPFGGSGTTLAAAILAGRNSIGIDLRKSQAELMHRRVEEARHRVSNPEPLPVIADVDGQLTFEEIGK